MVVPPISTPKWSFLVGKPPWVCWGNPPCLGVSPISYGKVPSVSSANSSRLLHLQQSPGSTEDHPNAQVPQAEDLPKLQNGSRVQCFSKQMKGFGWGDTSILSILSFSGNWNHVHFSPCLLMAFTKQRCIFSIHPGWVKNWSRKSAISKWGDWGILGHSLSSFLANLPQENENQLEHPALNFTLLLKKSF